MTRRAKGEIPGRRGSRVGSRVGSLALFAAAALVWPPPGQPLAAQDVRLEADAAGDRPGAVHLLLLSETGEPLVGGRIELLPEGDGPPGRTAQGPEIRALQELGEGWYGSGPLVPGAYRLRASAPGHAPATSRIRLRAGEVREPTVRLTRRPLALPEIVAAARGGHEIHATGHRIDVVSFRERPLGGATLAEWLRSLPGVHVRRSAAGRQVVSVRGSRPEGVLVLLDGIPLNDPMTGVADLTAIPPATLESATLVRGAGAPFGNGALAGALVLRSARPDDTSASMALEAGSHGYRAADARLSASGRPGQLALGLHLDATDNDFRFENRLLPGRPTETRRNADTQGAHVVVSASSATWPLSLRLRLDGVEQGAPGRMGTALFDRARWEEGGLQAALEVGRARASAAGSYRHRTLRYRDPRAGREEEQGVREFHLRGGLPLRDGWRLSGHLEHASVQGDGVAGSGVAGTADRTAAGTALTTRLEGGPIRVRPGVAVDAVEAGLFWSPFLGVELDATRGWTLSARVGQALRLPALGDQYTTSSARVRPNPSLRPERIVLDVETGAAWRAAEGRAGARLSAYHRRTADPIVWLASAVALWSPRNLDRLTAEGVEADAFWLPSPRWRLEVAASHERSRVGFGANRNPLPYAPAIQGRASVERSRGRGALRIDAQAVGSRTTSLAGTHRLPGLVLLGGTARQELAPGGLPMTVEVRLRNALDTRYELVSLVPEPGRSLELRVQIGPPGGNGKRPAAAVDETSNRE